MRICRFGPWGLVLSARHKGGHTDLAVKHGRTAATATQDEFRRMTFHRLTHALLQGKPYFGSALRALQGDASRHQYFEPAVRRAAALNKGKSIDILEVGSWAGASAVTWARALQAVGCGGRVTCVDTWAPYFNTDADAASHYRDMDEAARRGEIYRLFLHNVEACGVAEIVSHHVIDSSKMGSLFESGSFSIVYIDGNHALDFVRSDIALAKTLTRANGIICGDDLEITFDDVEAAAHRAQLELAVDYAYSEQAKAHYHPGVTEAVHEAFGVVANYSGFWAVEQLAGGWTPAKLDTARATLPDHIRDAMDDAVELVGEVSEFNIVSASGRYAAISKTLGPIEVFSERIGERDLSSLVLSGDSADVVLDKVRRAVSAAEDANAARAADEQHWTALSRRTDALGGRIDVLSARMQEQIKALNAVTANMGQRISAVGTSIEERMGLQTITLTAAINELKQEINRQYVADNARALLLNQRIDRVAQDVSRLDENDAQSRIELERVLQMLRGHIDASAGRLSAEAALTQAALTSDIANMDLRIAALDEADKRSSAEAIELRRLLSALTHEVIEADDRIDDLTRLRNSSLARRLRNLFRIDQVTPE